MMMNEPQTPAGSEPSSAEQAAAEETANKQQEAPTEVAPDLSVERIAGLLEDDRDKADSHWDQLLRARAELENERRRFQRDLENAHKFGLERFALELLPVKDSLELGLSATGEGQDLAKVREGVELTLKMINAAFQKFGIHEVDPAGQRFNPELHQAMSATETDQVEPNTVVAVYQKGYLLKERLLRPALVVVAKAPSRGEHGA
jgi:molecular chaperone GrpE